MDIFSGKTNFDFMGKGKIAAFFSFVLIVMSFYTWFEQGETKYGTDFNGGYEFTVRVEEATDETTGVLRKAFSNAGFNNVVIQEYEGDRLLNDGKREYGLRLSGNMNNFDDSKASSKELNAYIKDIETKVKQTFDATFTNKYELLNSSYIGPTIGDELKKNALTAFIIGLFIVLAYISYRFEFAFALGAVVAVAHDAIVTGGLYLITGHSITMTTVAAVLTIVGYSVNDTIVIFDRVREVIFKKSENEKLNLVEIFNQCINETLSRTIVTSISTLLAALALLFLGGGAIEDLSFFMVVGVIVGTYSTIYIASPVVLAWEKFRTKDKKAEA